MWLIKSIFTDYQKRKYMKISTDAVKSDFAFYNYSNTSTILTSSSIVCLIDFNALFILCG